MKKISKITVLAACILITPCLQAYRWTWFQSVTASYFSSFFGGNRRSLVYTFGVLLAGLALLKADASAAPVAGPSKPQPKVPNLTKPQPNKEYDTCSLCVEDLKPEDRNTESVGACMHIMHINCLQQIKEYARTKNATPTCPVCRALL